MLAVFVMIESYCNLLAERINLLKHEKVCPEELREAVSGLLYASTRCGEFPELIEIRAIFVSRFGKEFAARAIELRNNCGISPRLIQKLSTRQPTLENRLKVLKEIAAENNIILKFEEDYSIAEEENLKNDQDKHQPKPKVSENLGGEKIGDGLHNFTGKFENMEELSDSIKEKRKYKDVADAAQAAFESAAYAAAAARMAVVLSKSENHDPDDQNNPSSGGQTVRDEIDTTQSDVQPTKQSTLSTVKDQTVGREFGKSDFVHKHDSETEDEEIHSDNGVGESVGLISKSDEAALMEKVIVFDKSDDEKRTGEGEVLSSTSDSLGVGLKSTFATEKDAESTNLDTEMDRSHKRYPLRSETGAKANSWFEEVGSHFNEESKKPVSVRTRFRDWKH